MDKYQKYLLNRLRITEWHCLGCDNSKNTESTFCSDTDTLTIIQNENPEFIEYEYCILNRYDALSKVSFWKNGKWTEIDCADFESTKTATICKVRLNFDDRIEKIRLTFKNQLADDYVVHIKYVEADQEAWARKIEKEQRESLIAAANIKVSTGIDTVNIYFQPCCRNYASAEITLFKDDMMLAKYKVDEDVFFKSINGLAFGKYEFILKQYDDKKNVVLESDKISFSLVMPRFSDKPVINI